MSYDPEKESSASMIAVAKIAGVSQATVSRVYNGGQKVSSATKRRVEDAMKELGYPVTKPQNRQQGAARSIAVLALDDSLQQHGAFSMAIFKGVQEAAAQEGISTFISSIHYESEMPNWVKEVNPDGVLLIGTTSRPEIKSFLKKTPAIWLTSHSEAGADAVLPGNNTVGKLAANYLIESGCRNLAFLSANPNNPSYRVRGNAFESEVKQRGHSVRLLTLKSSDATTSQTIVDFEPRIEQLVEKLRKWNPLPDGLFIPSDFMTALTYRSLNAAGIKPGKDVKIVSCDNEEPYLAGLSPRPATIDIAGEARGRRALHELLWRIKNPDETVSVQLIVEPRLVIRS